MIRLYLTELFPCYQYNRCEIISIINLTDQMCNQGWQRGGAGTSFAIPYSFPHKKFIIIPILKPNGYQTFVSSPSPPGNGYNLVPIPVPVF